MRNCCLKIMRPVLCGFAVVFSISLPVDAAQVGALLQSELAKSNSARKIPIIVRMHDPVDVRALATPTRKKGFLRAQARANLINTLKARAARNRQPMQAVLNRHGIHHVRQLWLINGQSFAATPAQIDEISRLPEVASVTVDGVIELPKVVPSQVAGPTEPNLSLIKAPDLWALGHSGQGVTVAIMDSGVDINHPDLGPRWRGLDGVPGWYDPNDEHPDVPTDKTGHGTMVTGVVLGGDNSGTFIGAAPGAQWVGVKIFADNDEALYSAIHDGFQWLLDPDGDPFTDDAPADIVNNSYRTDAPGYCDVDSLEFQSDIEALKAAGIAVVFSAGNTGPDPGSSVAPANYPESFAVGSVGTYDSSTDISSFSARGPSACDNDNSLFPEVVAPGFNVKTSDLSAGGLDPNPYTYVATGTSFAAPHVSGAMALLRGAFPEASVSLLETALTQSAVDLGELGEDNTYGYGLVDALAAFFYLDAQINTGFHLLAPNRGEVWTRGTTYTLRWVPDPAADNYRLAYFDADNKVHAIGSVGNVDSFNWTIPLNTLAEPGKSLRVAAFNGTDLVGTDRSDQPFTILPQMFPNGGEILTPESVYRLAWAPVSGADKYRLFYFDADHTPHFIASVGNVASFNWTVPAAALAEPGKRFRVTAFSEGNKLPLVQWSEGTFTIGSQISPNGGEVLTAGTTYPLSWAAISDANKYRLYYFDNDGTSHLIAQVGNVTGYNWVVPGENSVGGGKLFRVTAFNGAAKLSEIQWSDETFSIVEP